MLKGFALAIASALRAEALEPQPGTRLRVRKGLGAVKSAEAHVRTDLAARAAAIEEVMGTFAKAPRAK